MWQELMGMPVVRVWSAARVWAAFVIVFAIMWQAGLRVDLALIGSWVVKMLFADLHRLKFKDSE